MDGVWEEVAPLERGRERERSASWPCGGGVALPLLLLAPCARGVLLRSLFGSPGWGGVCRGRRKRRRRVRALSPLGPLELVPLPTGCGGATAGGNAVVRGGRRKRRRRGRVLLAGGDLVSTATTGCASFPPTGGPSRVPSSARVGGLRSGPGSLCVRGGPASRSRAPAVADRLEVPPPMAVQPRTYARSAPCTLPWRTSQGCQSPRTLSSSRQTLRIPRASPQELRGGALPHADPCLRTHAAARPHSWPLTADHLARGSRKTVARCENLMVIAPTT